jgi:hypothetical protein
VAGARFGETSFSIKKNCEKSGARIINLDLPGITWDNHFNEVQEVLVAYNRKDFCGFFFAGMPPLPSNNGKGGILT